MSFVLKIKNIQDKDQIFKDCTSMSNNINNINKHK